MRYGYVGLNLKLTKPLFFGNGIRKKIAEKWQKNMRQVRFRPYELDMLARKLIFPHSFTIYECKVNESLVT